MATSSRQHLIKVPPLALIQTWSIEEAPHFSGPNIFGEELLGGVSGNYEEADLGNLMPNNKYKENWCTTDLNDETVAKEDKK